MEKDNPKDAEVFSHIDATLEEYDHRRVIEESNWADLMELVASGDLTQAEADSRYRDWRFGKGYQQ